MAKTIEQIQQMITDKYDVREVINELTDYVQANPGGGGGGGGVQSVTYTATAKHVGTSAPEILSLWENTLGVTLTWEYVATGIYIAPVPAGTFPDPEKIICSVNWYSGGASFQDFIALGYEKDWDTGIDAFVIRTWHSNSPADEVLGAVYGGGNFPTGLKIIVKE